MADPQEPHPLQGTFWQADTPDRRVPGQLTINDRDRPMLETLGRIFDERAYRVKVSPHGGVTVTHSGDPEDLVADFQPRTIHGELKDGTPVSIVEAQGHKKSSGFFDLEYRQEFRARHVIMNEHIKGAEQKYSHFKFRVKGPQLWLSNDGEALTADGSRLLLTTDEDGRWFEYSAGNPLTVEELDRWVASPITTLTSLVTDDAAADADLYVRLTADSPWRKVFREQESVETSHHDLLDTSHLVADRFASWIDLRKRTDGLDAGAIDKLDGVAIQTEVLTLAAVAEGLHRRLFDEKKRVPLLSSSEVKQLRRAARTAALDRLSELDRTGEAPLTDTDRTEFEKAINDAFSFLNDQTFRSRMKDLVNDAQGSIPNIVAAFADWPDAVKFARNTLAHRGTLEHDEAGSTNEFYNLLIALKYSIAWVLRTNLLNRAGFDAATLQSAYNLSSAYNHHITNTRYLLACSPYATGA